MQKQQLKIGNFFVEELIKQYGSPLYVYDQKIIEKQCQALKCALQKVPTKVKALYACKANTNREILKIIKQQGIDGIDAVSPGEIFVAQQSGYKNQDILYTENYASNEEIEFAIKQGVILNIGELQNIEKIGKSYPGSNIAIRINPNIGSGEHSHVITGGPDSKFGIYYSQTEEILQVANKYNLKIIGIHQHIGSNIHQGDIDKYVGAANCIFEQALKFKDLQFVNIGGGIGVPYKQDDIAPILEELFQKMAIIYNNFVNKFGRSIEFWTEPGRFLVAQSGILLCTATALKSNQFHNYIGTDTGFNHLVRPAMYGSYHKIINASNYQSSQTIVATICGNICENGDLFGVDRQIEETAQGDILAILNAGAYGFSMSSNYNTRCRPAEILINYDEIKLIRKRETLEDILKTQL